MMRLLILPHNPPGGSERYSNGYPVLRHEVNVFNDKFVALNGLNARHKADQSLDEFGHRHGRPIRHVEYAVGHSQIRPGRANCLRLAAANGRSKAIIKGLNILVNLFG